MAPLRVLQFGLMLAWAGALVFFEGKPNAPAQARLMLCGGTHFFMKVQTENYFGHFLVESQLDGPSFA
mgnify:CR=1 FL=1